MSLEPFLIHSVADLNRVYDIAREQSQYSNQFKLSGHSLLEAIKEKMPHTEIASVEEARNLLRALGFKPAHLKSDHYYKIGTRADVEHHLSQFGPVIHTVLESGEFFVAVGDASPFNENDASQMVWLPMDVPFSELQPMGTGKGPRLNVFEFATEDGLLRHPDGADNIRPFTAYLTPL